MIIHVDGDAFFASVYQAVHPETKGKPVVVGQERGMATALSYEAKAFGVKRGMLMHEIRRLCPQVIIARSDYRTYEIYSRRMVEICKQISPQVERYSIDEAFLDISHLIKNGAHNPYDLGKKLKDRVEKSLNITVSVGIAPTKCLSKVASSFDKPSGLVYITRYSAISYLRKTAIDDIWGIGYRLGARMRALGISTAYEFYLSDVHLIEKYFNKLVVEIWHELHGKQIYPIDMTNKTTYQSIRSTQTYTPATRDPEVLYARLLKHIEKAFIKARRYSYRVKGLSIFLKTQAFTFSSAHVPIEYATSYPFLIKKDIRRTFEKIYKTGVDYRAVGCTLFNLESDTNRQEQLFYPHTELDTKLRGIYPLIDQRKIQFGSSLREKLPHRTKHMFGIQSVSNRIRI